MDGGRRDEERLRWCGRGILGEAASARFVMALARCRDCCDSTMHLSCLASVLAMLYSAWLCRVQGKTVVRDRSIMVLHSTPRPATGS